MAEQNLDYFSVYSAYSTAQTDAILWSPASTKRFVVTDLIINTKAANIVTIEEDSGADKPIFKFDLAANATVVINLQSPFKGAVEGADLLITSTATTDLFVTVCGYEEE